MRTNLKVFRIKQNMTQAEFANATGYSRCHYAKIESGEKNMPLKLLENIQQNFRISDSELLDLKKNDRE